jgi:hypothetical protein
MQKSFLLECCQFYFEQIKHIEEISLKVLIY